jgi:hypothetical protein
MDLDDTLWPSRPTIERTETSLYAWLEQTAPRLSRACDQEVIRLHRLELMASRPDIAHNITAVRWQSLWDLLCAYGYDAELADV